MEGVYNPFLFSFLFYEEVEEGLKLHVAVQDPEANNYTAGANPGVQHQHMKEKKNLTGGA